MVVREEPFQRTVEPFRNPDPLTVSVKAGPPAVAEVGETPDRDGVGALITNVSAPDVVPPGFCTVTLALPCEAMRLADTEALSWLLLM